MEGYAPVVLVGLGSQPNSEEAEDQRLLHSGNQLTV